MFASQSNSLSFLLVLQLPNHITNRLVTCTVHGKFWYHLIRASCAFTQQQNVPPSDVYTNEHWTESDSTHADFFIKTPSTFLPKTPSLSHNQCFLDASLIYAVVSSLICLRHGCLPKKGQQIKHFLVATSTLRNTQSHPLEGSFIAPSEPLDACLNHRISKPTVERNHMVRCGRTSKKRRWKHCTMV